MKKYKPMNTKNKFIFLLLLLMTLSLSCTWLQKPGPALNPQFITLPNNGYKVVDGINYLGINVINKLIDSLPQENIIISPINLSVVLTILCEGANNQTKDEIKNILHFNGLEEITVNSTFKSLLENLPKVDPNVDFLPANTVWIKDGFILTPDFVDKINTYFLTNFFVMPFNSSTLNQINNWIKDKTHGKIDYLMQTSDQNDIMDIINAYYFSARWFDGFNPENTQKADFTTCDNQTLQVTMMQDLISQARFVINDSVSIGEIYFGNGNYSMIFVVPRTLHTLDEIVSKLTPEIWNNWMSSLTTLHPVLFEIPRLNINKFYNFDRELKLLGLSSTFTPQADFSGISQGVYLTKAFQRTILELKENGINDISNARERRQATGDKLIANQPFLFAIRETTTGVMLILGIVRNPNQ